MEKSIEDQVKEIVSKQLSVDMSRVAPCKSIENDLGGDRLDVVRILMAAEVAFSICITEDESETVDTVGDLVALVKKLVDDGRCQQ